MADGNLFEINKSEDGKPYVNELDPGNRKVLSTSETFEEYESAEHNAREQGGEDATIIDNFHGDAG